MQHGKNSKQNRQIKVRVRWWWFFAVVLLVFLLITMPAEIMSTEKLDIKEISIESLTIRRNGKNAKCIIRDEKGKEYSIQYRFEEQNRPGINVDKFSSEMAVGDIVTVWTLGKESTTIVQLQSGEEIYYSLEDENQYRGEQRIGWTITIILLCVFLVVSFGTMLYDQNTSFCIIKQKRKTRER